MDGLTKPNYEMMSDNEIGIIKFEFDEKREHINYCYSNKVEL
jgi:hypothetical protein